MDGWMDGWMGGCVGGSKSHFKDCEVKSFSLVYSVRVPAPNPEQLINRIWEGCII